MVSLLLEEDHSRSIQVLLLEEFKSGSTKDFLDTVLLLLFFTKL